RAPSGAGPFFGRDHLRVVRASCTATRPTHASSTTPPTALRPTRFADAPVASPPPPRPVACPVFYTSAAAPRTVDKYADSLPPPSARAALPPIRRSSPAQDESGVSTYANRTFSRIRPRLPCSPASSAPTPESTSRH